MFAILVSWATARRALKAIALFAVVVVTYGALGTVASELWHLVAGSFYLTVVACVFGAAVLYGIVTGRRSVE